MEPEAVTVKPGVANNYIRPYYVKCSNQSAGGELQPRTKSDWWIRDWNLGHF